MILVLASPFDSSDNVCLDHHNCHYSICIYICTMIYILFIEQFSFELTEWHCHAVFTCTFKANWIRIQCESNTLIAFTRNYYFNAHPTTQKTKKTRLFELKITCERNISINVLALILENITWVNVTCIMTLNTDKNNNVIFEGISMHYY